MKRSEFLDALAGRIASLPRAGPMRVAIDGVDGAGKTTLANELAPLVQARGRPVVRVGIDDFHHPAARRYRRGHDSPEGYYHDSFDYEAFQERVIAPSGEAGNRRVVGASHDLDTDARVDPEPVHLVEHGILLVDGIFLHRSALREVWDFSVFLRAAFDQTVARAVARDGGDAAAVAERYRCRYVPGQRLYFAEAEPERHADWVVEHGDPGRPEIVRSR